MVPRFLFFLLVIIKFEKTYSISDRTFPYYFKIGTATASYQVEGGWNEDGKSENIWDHITHNNPAYVVNGDNGDIACDSYHKYKEDVALLKELGVDYYRFSLSWSRIIPSGLAGSPVNPTGIEYYRNLTYELISNGIEPVITLFHWDTPQILEDMGGWPNEEIVEHYVYYAKTAFEYLGDEVKLWLTFNEPKQTCLQGYGDGNKAPGLKASGISDYKCAHTLLKAHARAYRLYDEQFRAKQDGRVGIVIDSNWFEPASGSDRDREAAERALQFTFGWYANPIFIGDYPQVMIDRIGERSKRQGYAQSRLPQFTNSELDYIKGTYDFLALNHYSTDYAAWQEETVTDKVGYDNDLNVNIYTDDSWESIGGLKAVPWGFRKILNWVSTTYRHPEIYVTENGCPDNGTSLEDTERIFFFKNYLSNLLDALYEDGVNVTRYTVWSLMDNFEWKEGYSKKLGLYRVDFDDPERPRIPKSSVTYLSNVTSTRCLSDSCK